MCALKPKHGWRSSAPSFGRLNIHVAHRILQALLQRSPERLTELQCRARVNYEQLVGYLNRFEHEGLVELHYDTDGAHQVSLTTKGHEGALCISRAISFLAQPPSRELVVVESPPPRGDVAQA